MTFEVGETVVYPHHGAARIIDIRQRKVRGQEKTYLQLAVAQGNLIFLQNFGPGQSIYPLKKFLKTFCRETRDRKSHV